MPRKELFYYVTWGSNVTRAVHWCVTVFYQQIENSNIANQIHGFTIDYGKFILIYIIMSRLLLLWHAVNPLPSILTSRSLLVSNPWLPSTFCSRPKFIIAGKLVALPSGLLPKCRVKIPGHDWFEVRLDGRAPLPTGLNTVQLVARL